MAELSDETITTIIELMRRLAKLMHRAAATELSIYERFGETEATAEAGEATVREAKSDWNLL